VVHRDGGVDDRSCRDVYSIRRIELSGALHAHSVFVAFAR
jgi:hypothetical protein